ncbi:hypothetical protein GFS24_18080 [Chitinophaga sp. SYP-B3965]|uniref:hypothetical protein n=1 Tax=Chitinophaga sp. SYP-B3965 TaxID=2663120 RepID=UPI001299FEE6|nr:hypothetical protein [Chitinophaga sp. SYP-B3965]MRG47037.1 hypothetical protein [Chitinophaga sp. SYP-B3965]
MKYFLFLICVCFLACKDKGLPDEINDVYQHREDVLHAFKNISIFKEGGKRILFIYTYDKGNKNEYVFDLIGKKYIFYRESILFSPDTIGLKIRSNNEGPISEYGMLLLKQMENLGLRAVTREFYDKGIDLQFHTNAGKILIYVSDMKKIEQSQWKDYLNQLVKIDDNWYY